MGSDFLVSSLEGHTSDLGQAGQDKWSLAGYMARLPRMFSHLSSWVVPLLLVSGCVYLSLNILSSKETNKELSDDVEKVKAELKIENEGMTICRQKLESDSLHLQDTDLQLASQNEKIIALTNQKASLEAQLTEKRAELEKMVQGKEAAEAIEAAAKKVDAAKPA